MDFTLDDGSREPLKKALYAEYGSPDKRVKRLEKIDFFIVDDRKARDHDAAGKLFLWFCKILATPVMGGSLEVTLRGDVPMGPTVKAWISQNNATYAAGDIRSSLTFVIEKGQQSKLHGLADAFRNIVKRRYSTKSYKYVCPRTADSLERLQRVLDNAWLD
jgi:hypothetical protein